MHVTGGDLVLRIEAVQEVFSEPEHVGRRTIIVRIDLFNHYLKVSWTHRDSPTS